MTKDEALALALQALDKLYLPGELERVNSAILAIREALAIDTSCQRVEELQGREHETAQQPAMRRATREEKISNPRVYEVTVDTSPPENKPWVGLTPEDIAGAPDNPIALIAYIEAKLREKNGGAA